LQISRKTGFKPPVLKNLCNDNTIYILYIKNIMAREYYCPVKMGKKQNSLYFDLLNGIKKSP
jgi:hypothetical protein